MEAGGHREFVSVSCGCCNELPKLSALKQAGFCLTVVEVRSLKVVSGLKSVHQQGGFLPECPRGTVVSPSSWQPLEFIRLPPLFCLQSSSHHPLPLLSLLLLLTFLLPL